MKRLLHEHPDKALAIVSDSYIRFHPKDGELDLSMAYDFLVKGMAAKDIAVRHSFHEQTVYNKINLVQAFVESFCDYDRLTLVKGLAFTPNAASNHVYALLYMIMGKYQCTEETSIKRNEIISRISYFSHNKRMRRAVEELKLTRAVYDAPSDDILSICVGNMPNEFEVFETVEYENGSLCYTFSDVMMRLLLFGKTEERIRLYCVSDEEE